jgi:hypothetical protein
MTTTTGSTSKNVHEQFIMGKDDIAILQAEIATLKEKIAKLHERPSILFPSLSCTFKFTNNYDDEVYETECGNSLVFFDGGPRENEYKYCPFCGKVIIVIQDDPDGAQEE